MELAFKLQLVWSLAVHVLAGSPRKSSCTDLTHKHGANRKLDVSCAEKDAIISSIDVISGIGGCSGQHQCCIGKTPNLIVEEPNCFWQKKCSIHFPTDIIIMPMTSSQPCQDCIGLVPDYLRLNEVKCFTPIENTSDVIDICEKKEEKNLGLDSGLLRSHSQFPWEYESRSFVRSNKDRRVCEKTFWLSPNQSMLLISVYDLDIAEGDFLNVTETPSENNDTNTSNLTKDTTILYKDRKSVQFQFGIGQESNGGRGFVLCFIRLSSGQYTPNMNACSLLMKRQKVKWKKTRKQCTFWGCPPKKIRCKTKACKRNKKKEKGTNPKSEKNGKDGLDERSKKQRRNTKDKNSRKRTRRRKRNKINKKTK